MPEDVGPPNGAIGRDSGVGQRGRAREIERPQADEMSRVRHEHRLGVAAIDLEAGRPGLPASLLGTRQALPAFATTPAAIDEDRVADLEPGPPSRPSGLGAHGVDMAGHLVAQGQRQLDPGLAAVHDVKIGVAHPARRDPDADFGAGRVGDRDGFDPRRVARASQPHGEHRIRRTQARPRRPPESAPRGR